MKTWHIILLFIVFIMFSCFPIRYINSPKLQYPGICLNNPGIKKIILAKDHHIFDLSINSEMCFEGLISGIKTNYDKIEIIDVLNFRKDVDSTILNDVNLTYNADGLLLLINNEYSETIINYNNYAHNYGLKKYNSWSDVELSLSINTCWEYYDFETKESFRFYVYNEGKLSTLTESNMFDNKEQFIGAILFENGLLTSKELIGY